MASWIEINIGSRNHVIETAFLPPVGAILPVHKHLTEDGDDAKVKVVSHHWSLEEDSYEFEDSTATFPRIDVKVRTRLVE